MAKLPDFTAPGWEHISPRGRLQMLRDSILEYGGPIEQEKVFAIMTQMCKISIDLLDEAHSPSKFDMDKNQVERLLREQIAMYERFAKAP